MANEQIGWAYKNDISIQTGTNAASVASVKIIRARYLDDIGSQSLNLVVDNKSISVPVPSDIDDFEVSSSTIQSELNNDQTPAYILDGIKKSRYVGDGGQLRWQNSTDPQYRKWFENFFIRMKEKLVAGNTGLFSGDPDQFKVQDVAQYSTIKAIMIDMNFNNQADIGISLTKLRELQGDQASLAFIPRENDVLEIKFNLPDYDKPQTAFIGFITGVSYIKEFGTVTTINIKSFGISKHLMVNKMVVDRAIMSQFENGELAQTGLTVWSNYFANSKTDEIFYFLMSNELAMNIGGQTSLTEGSQYRLYNLEMESLRSLQTNVEANKNSQERTVNFGNIQKDIITDEIKQGIKDRAASVDVGFADSITETQTIRKKFLDQFWGANINNNRDMEYATTYLYLEEIRERVSYVNNKIKGIKAEAINTSDVVDFNLTFQPSAFSSPSTFQYSYVPLITMAAWRKDESVARYNGKIAAAFDLELRGAFQLYFSQMQPPSQVLDAIRRTAKFAVYENEDGQIVAELPRYNDFIADEKNGETIQNFIISNPTRSDNSRQDLDLVTRIDSLQFWPLVGQQQSTLFSQQFTDIAVLSKYGMRAESPIYNPNATSKDTATLYAALEVNNRNSLTRTASITHPMDRKFKLGRLYFLAIPDIENEAGGVTTQKEKTDGYVGYLVDIRIDCTYGSPITCTLTFNYVRKAKLIVSSNGQNAMANYKILPDLGTLIDVVENNVKSGKTGGVDPLNPPKQSTTNSPPNVFADFYTTKKPMCNINGSNLPSYGLKRDWTDAIMIPSILGERWGDGGDFTQVVKNNDVAPVIYSGAIQPENSGINDNMVTALYFLDTRLRYWNWNIYNPNRTPNLAFLDAMYIPSIKINPFYYLTKLEGIGMTSWNKSWSPISFKSSTGWAWGTVTSYIQLIGSPIVVGSSSKHFGILYMTAHPSINRVEMTASGLPFVPEPPGTILVSDRDNPNVKLTSSLFTYSEIVQGGTSTPTSQMSNNIGNYCSNHNGTDYLKDEMKFAVQQMSEIFNSETGSCFLPVVFESIPQYSILYYCIPGYGFTLMDISELAPLDCRYIANLPASAKNKKGQDAHAKGEAIDITLAPFYAKTGIRIRSDLPSHKHPLISGQYKYDLGGENFGNVLASDKIEMGKDTIIERDESVGKIFIDIKPEDRSTDYVKKIFDSSLSGNVYAPTWNFDPMLGLHSLDKTYRHVSQIPPPITLWGHKLPSTGTGRDFTSGNC